MVYSISQADLHQIARYSSCPCRLPKFPTNKMILLEVTRQLSMSDKIHKRKRKAGIIFPIILGNSIETCPSIPSAEGSEEEL